MDEPWRVELFGGLRAQRGDQILTRFRTQRTALLLAYLAYHVRRTHPRETLIELLWPESEEEVGRHKLSVALSALRGQLEPAGAPTGSVLRTDRFSAGLTPAAVTTDVTEFEAALAADPEAADGAEQARRLARAVDLYRGPLLAGFYDDWIYPEQQRWEELFFRTLRQLVAHHEQAGALDHALPYALRAVSVDPLREEAHREVIRLYALLDQPAAALRQFHDLKRRLQQELGEAPSEATQALVETIQRAGFRASDLGLTTTDPHRMPNIDRMGATELRHPDHPVYPVREPKSEIIEPVGGAVPLDSPFYITRDSDAEFQAAIARRDSIVLVKGARQTGKTSLLARGLQQAREAGARVALTLAVGETLGEQLDLDVMPDDIWESHRGPNLNFRRYMRREVMGAVATPLVWGLDEVDRLFECDFGGEIFALFRSWHNERALDPTGPWAHLTLVIAYATEVHLFITDLNQSPFNVGTRLTLEDLTLPQVADLNARYGSPLPDDTEVARFYRLVGGHPDLVRRGLHEMATHGTNIEQIESRAAGGEWIFGDHLRRLRALLARDPALGDAMREVLQGRPCPTPESFYRLRSAGLLTGDAEGDARPRCQLYAVYLERHLP
jgi:DNA-binding SARP family transcriptional activator